MEEQQPPTELFVILSFYKAMLVLNGRSKAIHSIIYIFQNLIIGSYLSR
jgi:hypothetical protein